MSKSKTPVADKYVAEYHERLKNTGCSMAGQEIEALRAIELELLNTKEQAPTKAIEVLKSIDDLVTKKVEEREKSTLLEHKSILDYEYLNKTKELEFKFEKEKKALVNQHEILIKDYTLKLQSKDKDYQSTVTRCNELHKEVKAVKSDYVSEFMLNLIKRTENYETISIPVNKFLDKGTVKISKKYVIEFFYDRFNNEGLI